MIKIGGIDITDTLVGTFQPVKIMVGADQVWPDSTVLWEPTAIVGAGDAITVQVSGVGDIDFGDGSALVPYAGNIQNKVHTYVADYNGPIKFYGTLTRFSCNTRTLNHTMASIPSGITYFRNQTVNSCTGYIGHLEDDMENFYLQGAHTVNMDLYNLPSSIKVFGVTGSAIPDSSYISGHVFSNEMVNFSFQPSTGSDGLNSTEVDNILIDIDSSNTLGNMDIIKLDGAVNGPRTSASDAAIASLTAAGCTTITTN